MLTECKEAIRYLHNNVFTVSSSEYYAGIIEKELAPQFQRYLLLGDNGAQILHTVEEWREHLTSYELDEVVEILQGHKIPLLSQLERAANTIDWQDIQTVADILLGRENNQ